MRVPKVLIADELSANALEVFRTRGIDVDVRAGLGKSALLQIIGDYEGLAVRSATKADKDVIAAASRLTVIGRAGIGVDNVDLLAATARGIVVMNTPFGNSITTAEHAIALLFAAARHIAAADRSTQAGKWEKSRFMGVELYAKTLGLIGCGNIGALVAERALALKMKVVAYDPFLSSERAVKLGVEKIDLADLLARADVISLHTPLTDKTSNILSADALARTKRGVIIVNAARGGLVDEDALRAALDSGHVAAAGFDVFITEPATSSPLFGAPNFVATPHLGASTNEAQENVALQVAEQISDYLLTGAVANALNMASVSAEEASRLKPFLGLVDKLGSFAGQIADDGIEAVELGYEGEVAGMNMQPLTATALAALMRPLMPDVNVVSAPAVLKQKGALLTETRCDSSPIYGSLIRIKVLTGGRWRSLAGVVNAGTAKIVEVKNMPLEADFHPVMLLINNFDRPGFIGALGMILGEAGINIATFHLGRQAPEQDAIALIGVDQIVPEDIQRKLRVLPHVRYVKMLIF
ncbi:MAG: phosphoglycerate dehydrogenase [Pseudomonadota bacterium]|nr:phosphoglycerate dehydrogenase [Pseudomonadota bacterium]